MCEGKKACSCGCSTKKVIKEGKTTNKKPLKEGTWAFEKSKVNSARADLQKIMLFGKGDKSKALLELRIFEKKYWNIIGDDIFYDRIDHAISELELNHDSFIHNIENAIIRMEQLETEQVENIVNGGFKYKGFNENKSKKEMKPILLEKIDLKLTSNTKRELIKQAKNALDSLYSIYDIAEKQNLNNDKFLSFVDTSFEGVNELLTILVVQDSIEKK